MDAPHVFKVNVSARETFMAYIAVFLFLLRVGQSVPGQIILPCEALWTNRAQEWLLILVNIQMLS